MTHRSNLATDEVLFDCVRAALGDAGLRKQDVDLSVVASLDLYDGCSMSNSFTVSAAAGWMTGTYRLETDAGMALICGAAAIACGDADVVVVGGLHHPQGPAGEGHIFDEVVSGLSFDPQWERPVGLSAVLLFALHAARAVSTGATTISELATMAAAEISRGCATGRATRQTSCTPADVLSANPVAWPLTQLMLPAASSGAVALVLASPERARLCRRTRARLVGWGAGASGTSYGPDWLEQPEVGAATAAATAYDAAGLNDVSREVDVVELSAATPALVSPLRKALGIDPNLPSHRINPSGGVRSTFPGVANGALRVLEAIRWMEQDGGDDCKAVAHSAETITGPVAASTTVFVLGRL